MAAFAPAPPHHLQHHQAPPTHHLQHPHSQLFGAQGPPPPQGPPPSQQQQQQGPPQPQDTTTHFDVQVRRSNLFQNYLGIAQFHRALNLEIFINILNSWVSKFYLKSYKIYKRKENFTRS